MNRFLSKREKNGSGHGRERSRDKSSDKKTRPLSNENFLALFKSDPQKKIDKEISKQTSALKDRLQRRGYSNIDEEHVTYALSSKYADGDVDKAFELLLLFQESAEGVIKPYDPGVHMLGAVNRGGVTCYLDGLLFAMFSRLGSFEPILHTTFEDEPRRRLSTLIRLWVNLLRTGKLIETDLTSHLQEALAACGWPDATKLEQQDTSEAFSFITGILELPLLTLKMDIYHTGTEDDTDDHKFVQERLLEVAVPENNNNERPIRLEDCLESYFNNRVEVVRRLERSNTLSSVRSHQSYSSEKEGAQHIEISDLGWSTPDTPSSTKAPSIPISPVNRQRAPSIIRSRVIQEEENNDASDSSSRPAVPTQIHKASVRKEVLMPAWQFFNLIPWYTKHSAANDADVAAHFSQTRPVLGICLKRYAMTEDGQPVRKNTLIDIPLEIRLPHFIQDDMAAEDGPLMGNFKLSLQSLICHRGNSLHAGHYISFIRGTSKISDGDYGSARRLSNGNVPPHYPQDRWIKFDDMADPRVSYVDIEQAMKDEMPYLLFYQVQPTYETSSAPDSDILPPSYSDPGIGLTVSSPPFEHRAEGSQPEGYFDGIKDEPARSPRLSADIERPDEPRRSINLSEGRRGSLAFTETSIGSAASSQLVSAPVTPAEETTAQRMSRAAARFTRTGSKSRPTSASGEGRLSLTLQRLNWRASKEQLSNKSEAVKVPPVPDTDSVAQSDGPSEGRGLLNTDEASQKTVEDASPPKKANKKRERSKGPSETMENAQSHSHQGKWKSKDLPDRECSIM